VTGLEHLSAEVFWLALPVILVAGTVHGTFGIGFPLVSTPLLALNTDVRTAVLITLLPTIAVNLAILSRGAGPGAGIGPHWRVVPYVVTGAIVGTLMLLVLDPRPLLLVLAGAIVMYLRQDRLRALDFGWVRQRTGTAYALFGLAAGIMAGTVNVMVPILIILALELRIPTQAMVHLFNLNFLTAKVIQVLVFWGAGQVTWGGLAAVLPLIPAALVGLAAGTWLHRRITEERYRRALRGILWLMAAILVLRFLA
jgi:uncharacterized membrane protein YfcA